MAGSACGDVSGGSENTWEQSARSVQVLSQLLGRSGGVERRRWRMLQEINVALLTLSPSLSKRVVGRKTTNLTCCRVPSPPCCSVLFPPPSFTPPLPFAQSSNRETWHAVSFFHPSFSDLQE